MTKYDITQDLDAALEAERAYRTKLQEPTIVSKLEEIARLQAEVEAETADLKREAEEAKEYALQQLNLEGIIGLPGYELKTRVKREVLQSKLLEVLEGDYGRLLEASKVNIGTVESLIKLEPHKRDAYRSCIVETGVSVTDFQPKL